MTGRKKILERRRLLRALATVAWLAAGAGLGFTMAVAQTHQYQHAAEPTKSGWLVKLAPEPRAAAIERQFGGLAPTMAAVAYRYTEMYWGGVDGNWEYAAHMQEELRKVVELGLERRPEYRKSAENFLLKTTLPQVGEAIQKKNLDLFKQRIDALRAGCTGCHAAEKHGFIKIAVPTVRLNPLEKP
jgi:hypothetical protein